MLNAILQAAVGRGKDYQQLQLLIDVGELMGDMPVYVDDRSLADRASLFAVNSRRFAAEYVVELILV